VHGGAFCVLLLTGMLGFVAGAQTLNAPLRYTHLFAAAVFVLAPLVYLLFDRKAVAAGIREALTWRAEDLEWLMAFPRHYFLTEEAALPPQDRLNAFQKLWWCMVLLFGAVLVVSGAVMSALPDSGTDAFQWTLVFHQVAFITIGAMFLLHVYFTVAQPLSLAGENESIRAMTSGRVSAGYAREYHTRWFEKVYRKKGKRGK
jgi:formate dehydrogenase subunit gamma